MGGVSIGSRIEEDDSVTAMGERMTAELRSELHKTELQLAHWVAEREQRLADMQVQNTDRYLVLRFMSRRSILLVSPIGRSNWLVVRCSSIDHILQLKVGTKPMTPKI